MILSYLLFQEKETNKFADMIIICVTSSVGRAHDF